MGCNILMRTLGTGGTESSLMTVDVPKDGFIEAVHMMLLGDLDADTEEVIGQLSFGSTFGDTNDSRQVIAEIGVRNGLTTSGSGLTSANQSYNYPSGIPVAAGERLHLHIAATASVTSELRVIVVFSFDEPRARARRA